MFLPENASYVVDGVGVSGWYPGVFCALLRHFSRRFVEVREEWAGLEAGAVLGARRLGIAFAMRFAMWWFLQDGLSLYRFKT